jgi:N-acetylglucosamine kinase-like BadF-type ATPase
MNVCVGVDAGGTSTIAASSRDGAYWQTERAGPGNATSIGVDAAAAAIAEAVLRASGGVQPASLYVGAAGAGNPEIAGALGRSLEAVFPNMRAFVVTGDTEAALRAAIPEGPGVVLIAGTGSVGYGENGGRRVQVGGYGFLAGDEGSAFAIGFAAVKLLTRVYDGRTRADETTALAERVLGCNGRETLLSALYAGPLDVAKIASLAPSIIAFAGKGNRVSAEIVHTAAQALGDLVRSAVERAGLAGASPKIAFAGGLLRESSLLSTLLETRVTADLPGATIVRLHDEPARAALRFAEQMLEIARGTPT